MSRSEAIKTWTLLDVFVGYDKARDEHATHFRKVLTDAGLPRPNPNYEDFGDDPVMYRIGEWLDMYEGVQRRRQLLETGKATAEDLSEMMWRLERMGELRGQIGWRYNIDYSLGNFTPDEAITFKQKNISINRERGVKGSSASKKQAAQWKQAAQKVAEDIWERHPDWSADNVATHVLRKLDLGKSKSTVRQAIQKPDRLR